jgi:hypothetical protein
LLKAKIVTFFKDHLELLFWITGLVMLFFINPVSQHFSLCPLSNLGFDFCPGCGIGRSIHYAMWFNFAKSFAMHPLGIFALLIITFRIFKLIFHPLKTINYE